MPPRKQRNHKWKPVAALALVSVLVFAPRAKAQSNAQDIISLMSSGYDPKFTATEHVLTDNIDSCEQVQVELSALDPVSLSLHKINLRTYAPRGTDSSSLKTVLLIPPTGGENMLDRGYALAICQGGLRTAILEHWYGDDATTLDLSAHDKTALRGVSAAKHAIDYLKTTHPKQLGIIGTSLGAILASIVISVDDRASCGVLIAGGGNLPDILASTTETSLARLRSERMTHLNLASTIDYQSALAEKLKVEPLDFARRATRKNVLTILALKDSTVPTSDQYALYHAFGDQSLITFEADHVGTILRAYGFSQDRILDFFKTNLN